MRDINLVQLKNVKYNPEIFVPIRGYTELDKIWSKKIGVMPATITMVIGDPGIGKSTLMMEYLTKIEKQTPGKRVLFISAEMDRIDLKEYSERITAINDLTIMFLAEYIDDDPQTALEDLLQQGWDVVLIDSFQETLDVLCDEYSWSSKKTEKYIVELLKKHKEGKNDKMICTAFLVIQQVTKGGVFRGSNSLKHNTTAFLEIRSDEFDKPFLEFVKNRRGPSYIRLYFSFIENGVLYEPIKKDDDFKDVISKIGSEQKRLDHLFGFNEELKPLEK